MLAFHDVARPSKAESALAVRLNPPFATWELCFTNYPMSSLALELDSYLAHSIEESAPREHKPPAAWARERLRIAAMETEANGYPPGWLKLFASIEDETFASPSRIDTRPVAALKLE